MNKKTAKEMKEVLESMLKNEEFQKISQEKKLSKREKQLPIAFNFIYEKFERFILQGEKRDFKLTFVCPFHSDPEHIERFFVGEEDTIDIPVKEVAQEFEKLGYTTSLVYENNWVKKLTISF